MLLAEYVRLAHVREANGREAPVDLQQVNAFVFGEQYLIEMRNGKSYEVRDFEAILGVMKDEFTLWKNQFVPDVQIVSRSKGSIVGKTRQLTVCAAVKSTLFPAIPPDPVIDRVRIAVTIYNLSGTWDQFERSNL